MCSFIILFFLDNIEVRIDKTYEMEENTILFVSNEQGLSQSAIYQLNPEYYIK